MTLTILRILFLRLRNNPLELLLVFVMPVVFFTIFAAIFSNGIATGSDRKLRVGWITNRDTALGLQLKSFLERNSSLQCSSLIAAPTLTSEPSEETTTGKLEGETLLDEATIREIIAEAQKSGRYDLIVRLPVQSPGQAIDDNIEEPESGYDVALVTDGQNPMAVSMVSSVVRGFFAQKQAAETAEQMLTFQTQGRVINGYRGGTVEDHHLMPGTSLHAAQSRFFKAVQEPWEIFADPAKSHWLRRDADGVVTLHGRWIVPRHWAMSPSPAEESTEELLETLLAEKPISEDVEGIRIRVENPQAETQENPRIAMYAAGIAVLFLLFSATGNAAALLEEAESGTLDRILVSKAGLFPIVSGKWLGILVLGCLQITVMFVWAELMFRIQLGQHIAGFCVMTFSTAAATASFAMLLATLCKSRAQLNAVSVVIILSMSAVGGSMIPRFAMSDRMKEIGQWTFNAWALDGYQKVFWYQTPITSLFKEVSVLLGSALVLGILTLMLSGRWKRA